MADEDDAARRGGAARRTRVVKKRKSPDDDSATAEEKRLKVEEGGNSEAEAPTKLPPAKRPTKHATKSAAKSSNEMEFGLHVGHLSSPLMTFESTVRALLKTLDHGADIALAEQNMRCCAECLGGGELICCDCCQFAFHIDCLEPAERGTYRWAPYRKGGLRQGVFPEFVDEMLCLDEHEWFCPYCLSAPIQRHWKRGIPQFLRSFNGFDASVVSHNDLERNEGQLTAWCDEIGNFVNDPVAFNEQEVFPPTVLLAVTGIRRAIQRLGPTFQTETRAEIERLEQYHQNMQAAPPESPIVDEDVAEPVVKEESVKPKTNIMKSGSKSITEDMPEQPPSDELASDAEANKPVKPRPRRTRAKPIVPTDEPMFGDIEPARMNVGSLFQVPTIHKYYNEALELGCDYALIDKDTTFTYLPKDKRCFIPLSSVPAKNTCRLVYSVSQLQHHRRELEGLHENDPVRLNSPIPLNNEELAIYIRQVIALWPAWIQWPASQEFALKILHHCHYNTLAALRLLCTDGMQFKIICDPPTRPYMNKWRPRDKRGFIASIPYPPPSTALIYAGVGEAPNHLG